MPNHEGETDRFNRRLLVSLESTLELNILLVRDRVAEDTVSFLSSFERHVRLPSWIAVWDREPRSRHLAFSGLGALRAHITTEGGPFGFPSHSAPHFLCMDERRKGSDSAVSDSHHPLEYEVLKKYRVVHILHEAKHLALDPVFWFITLACAHGAFSNSRLCDPVEFFRLRVPDYLQQLKIPFRDDILRSPVFCRPVWQGSWQLSRDPISQRVMSGYMNYASKAADWPKAVTYYALRRSNGNAIDGESKLLNHRLEADTTQSTAILPSVIKSWVTVTRRSSRYITDLRRSGLTCKVCGLGYQVRLISFRGRVASVVPPTLVYLRH